MVNQKKITKATGFSFLKKLVKKIHIIIIQALIELKYVTKTLNNANNHINYKVIYRQTKFYKDTNFTNFSKSKHTKFI